MKKGIIIVLTMILVPALGLMAAGSSDGAEEDVVTVTYMTWDSGPGVEITKPIIAAFEAENPGIKVELQSVPQGYDDKVLTAHAAGDTPDGLLMWNTSQWAEAGIVQDLNPYISRDKYDMDQYLPVTRSWAEYKGGIYGLPKDFTPRAMYYNKNVFDEAGVAYPEAGWTFDDFVNVAKAINNNKTGADARYGYVAIPGHTYALQAFIWSNGGDLCSPDGTTASGYINTTAVVEVVEWYKTLFDLSISTGTMDAYQNLGQNEFQSGIVALMDNGMWPVSTYEADTSLSFGIVAPPIPEAGGTISPIIHSSTWSMFAKAENKDEVWEFIKYIGGPEGGRVFAEERWGLPVFKGMADELGLMNDEYMKVFAEVGDMATKAPVFVRSPKWFEADSEFKLALEQIFLENVDIQTALDEAAVRMDKILQSQ